MTGPGITPGGHVGPAAVQGWKDSDVMSLVSHPGAATHPPCRPAISRRAALRTITIGGAVATFPALLGCAPSSERSTFTASTTPAPVIMVIRHGEKPAKSQPVAGIDLSGRPDLRSLTEQGWTRAAYLVDLFTPTDTGHAPLQCPRVIYASGQGGSAGEGTRSRETVGPLAAALGIPVNTTFSRGQEAALADEAAHQAAPVLICWQHQSIPAIAAALRPATPAPPATWADDRYDVVWAFTPTSVGWEFAQVPELLLPGDSPTGLSGDGM